MIGELVKKDSKCRKVRVSQLFYRPGLVKLHSTLRALHQSSCANSLVS